MKIISIESLELPALKIYNTLRDKAFAEDNSFIADSPKVVNMLMTSDIQIKSILATQEYYDEFQDLVKSKNIPKLYVADKKLMQTIVGHKIHHNCMAHGVRPKESSLDELDDNIIMLDNITSTENIGSIARSAAALGVTSYLAPTSSPHPYTRRSLRVSMGYISHLKYHVYEDIISTCQELKKRGYKIFAAEVTDDSTPLWHVQIPKKWVLLMGHEGKGISKEVLDICDEVVTIEMQEGVKSFNVGVAASIMMYQFKNRYNCK
ncbi:TrmH family RNA methyltransferase [Sulfurimonas sp.]